jgi:quercetin dioxygenase-like cupin family protein
MSYPPPTYHGESGEVSAHVVRAGIEPATVYPNGNKVFYLAQGTETAGTFGLYRWEFAGPVSGPGAHFHRTITESFYVLEGTVTIFDGKDWARCQAGDFAHVPAGGIHGFRNEDGAATMLLHFAPGAPREAYFEQLAEGISDFDEDAYDRFMREHDNTWV